MSVYKTLNGRGKSLVTKKMEHGKIPIPASKLIPISEYVLHLMLSRSELSIVSRFQVYDLSTNQSKNICCVIPFLCRVYRIICTHQWRYIPFTTFRCSSLWNHRCWDYFKINPSHAMKLTGHTFTWLVRGFEIKILAFCSVQFSLSIMKM